MTRVLAASLSGTPPFLESSPSPAAVPGEHARPVSRPGKAAQPHAGSPASPSHSTPYFRSLLEHLGKARGLGDVKRHGQPAQNRSRARRKNGRKRPTRTAFWGRCVPPPLAPPPSRRPPGLNPRDIRVVPAASADRPIPDQVERSGRAQRAQCGRVFG